MDYDLHAAVPSLEDQITSYLGENPPTSRAELCRPLGFREQRWGVQSQSSSMHTLLFASKKTKRLEQVALQLCSHRRACAHTRLAL